MGDGLTCSSAKSCDYNFPATAVLYSDLIGACFSGYFDTVDGSAGYSLACYKQRRWTTQGQFTRENSPFLSGVALLEDTLYAGVLELGQPGSVPSALSWKLGDTAKEFGQNGPISIAAMYARPFSGTQRLQQLFVGADSIGPMGQGMAVYDASLKKWEYLHVSNKGLFASTASIICGDAASSYIDGGCQD